MRFCTEKKGVIVKRNVANTEAPEKVADFFSYILRRALENDGARIREAQYVQEKGHPREERTTP